jgi:hypothetical protein
MFATTVLLSQLIGLSLLVLGVALVINKKYYSSWFRRLDKESEAFLWVTSLIEFVAGLAIVLSHNLWGSPAQIIITLFGWCMVLEGAAILLGGKLYIQIMLRFFARSMGKATIFAALVFLALGIYLTWFGFFA